MIWINLETYPYKIFKKFFFIYIFIKNVYKNAHFIKNQEIQEVIFFFL